MTIAENIQTSRKVLGMTQERLAEEVGVSRQTVAKWESGETVPDLANAGALARALQTSLDTLVSFDPAEAGVPAPPPGKHLFGSVKVGERGQVVIPKEARDLFGIRPGDKMVVLGDEAQGLALVKSETFMAGIEQAMRAARRLADE